MLHLFTLPFYAVLLGLLLLLILFVIFWLGFFILYAFVLLFIKLNKQKLDWTENENYEANKKIRVTEEEQNELERNAVNECAWGMNGMIQIHQDNGNNLN